MACGGRMEMLIPTATSMLKNEDVFKAIQQVNGGLKIDERTHPSMAILRFGENL